MCSIAVAATHCGIFELIRTCRGMVHRSSAWRHRRLRVVSVLREGGSLRSKKEAGGGAVVGNAARHSRTQSEPVVLPSWAE